MLGTSQRSVYPGEDADGITPVRRVKANFATPREDKARGDEKAMAILPQLLPQAPICLTQSALVPKSKPIFQATNPLMPVAAAWDPRKTW